MLGAVMFAHAASKKVCEGIIKLAEKAAKEPWELPEDTESETHPRQAEGTRRRRARKGL